MRSRSWISLLESGADFFDVLEDWFAERGIEVNADGLSYTYTRAQIGTDGATFLRSFLWRMPDSHSWCVSGSDDDGWRLLIEETPTTALRFKGWSTTTRFEGSTLDHGFGVALEPGMAGKYIEIARERDHTIKRLAYADIAIGQSVGYDGDKCWPVSFARAFGGSSPAFGALLASLRRAGEKPATGSCGCGPLREPIRTAGDEAFLPRSGCTRCGAWDESPKLRKRTTW